MGLTQKEIAKQLGVSYMSVSRALNGSGYVSESLRMRILTYAKENGYEPHRASKYWFAIPPIAWLSSHPPFPTTSGMRSRKGCR